MTNLLIAVMLVIITGLIIYIIFSTKKPEVKKDNTLEIIDALKNTLKSISMDTMKEQIELAERTMGDKKVAAENALEEKKKLIDQQLQQVNVLMGKIERSINEVESKTGANSAAIINELKNSQAASLKLESTAKNIQEILGSSQKRGEWGQRAAEDIFNSAGVTKGRHFVAQEQQEAGGKPDFTFFLPHGKKVHIDAKFPLDNFARYVNAASKMEKDNFKAQYLKDVRAKLRELSKKEYISQAENTVDYMVMFIPNEQVYAFVSENDREFMDDALKSKIIVCGPYTLYAVVSTIREAVNNFQMAQAASETRELMEKFRKEWQLYTEVFDEVADAIDTLQEGFSKMVITRKKKLEAVLDEISELASSKKISTGTGDEEKQNPAQMQ